MKKDNGVVTIHGKEYQTVALRVKNFREKYEMFTIATDIVYRDENEVVIKATISDEAGRVLATGHGEENRSSSMINKTSALENCETSAIGRALACFGLGGTEFASADEVRDAIKKQEAKKKEPAKTVKRVKAITKEAALKRVNAANNGADLKNIAAAIKPDCEKDLDLDEYAEVSLSIEAKLHEFRIAAKGD